MNNSLPLSLQQSLTIFFGVKAAQEVEEVASHFSKFKLQKGNILMERGRKTDQLVYLTQGYLRIFLHNGEKEVTQWVASAGYFMTDLQGFFYHQPARFTMQAITDLEGYQISKEEYQRLHQRIPRWIEFERHFLLHCMNTMENRILSHLSMSAEERYSFFWDHHRHLFLQVPQQYLASLLGMTPETFSRLRRKIAG
jgi:CRP-like cAMP-binding protein